MSGVDLENTEAQKLAEVALPYYWVTSWGQNVYTSTHGTRWAKREPQSHTRTHLTAVSSTACHAQHLHTQLPQQEHMNINRDVC